MTNDAQSSPKSQLPPLDGEVAAEAMFGLARIKAGPDGLAVRLARLVRYLMERHQTSRLDAVNSYLKPVLGLKSNASHMLYAMNIGGGFAQPLSYERASDRLREVWDRWGKLMGTDAMVLDNPSSIACSLAVSEADARRCWGWGEDAAGVVASPVSASPFPLTDWPALVAFRAANPGVDWSRGNQIDVALQELERRTSSGKTKSAALNEMGWELGMKGKEPRKPLLASLKRDRMRNRKSVSGPPATQVIKVKNGRKVS